MDDQLRQITAARLRSRLPALAFAFLPPWLSSLGHASAQTISNQALVLPPATNPDPAAPIEADIRDIVPPVEIPSWAWLGWLALLAALLAAAVMLYRRWRRNALIAAQPPPVPPHVRARERLRKALSLLEDPRLFCGAVSTALRVYLEEQFQLHAPERTTGEFLVELKTSHHLNPEQKSSLAHFLEQCDLVKFARHEPPESGLRELHESALRLIDETQFSTHTGPGETIVSPPPLPVDETQFSAPRRDGGSPMVKEE